MDYRYQIYGLLVESSEPLKGVLPSSHECASNLRIEWKHDNLDSFVSLEWLPVAAARINQSNSVLVTKAKDGNRELWRLRYDIDNSSCDFVFDQSGRTLYVVYPSHIVRSRLVSYLLGSVMSSILRLQGTICLHASVVSFNGKALALAGRKGAGKSTLSTALAQRGAEILSDDIAAIVQSGNHFWVHPGDMRPRLLQNSVEKLFGEFNSLRKANSPDDKVRVTMNTRLVESGQGHPKAAPLLGFCLLENGIDSTLELTVSALQPGERFMSLSQHLYGFCLDKNLTQAKEFKTLGQLADRIPIIRIVRPNNLEKLHLVCDAVMAEFGRLESASVSR